MTTFAITNTIQENDTTIIIFVKYSNGNEETERFSITAQVSDILQRLNDRATWYDEREELLKQQVIIIQEGLEPYAS